MKSVALLSRKIALLLSLASILAGCGAASHAPVQADGIPHGAEPGVAPGAAGAAESQPVDADPGPISAVALSAVQGLGDILPALDRHRVVFVGETHDRYEHHLNQLAVLRGLYRRNPDLAVGVEWFQQPFQAALDAYVAGRIDQRELLQRSEYFDRWRFDWRLYAPILRFARKHRIPVVALNLPAEITRQVGREGLASLSPEQRAVIPAVVESEEQDARYRADLKAVFERHPHHGQSFEHFLTVQRLWDEGMAARAAEYLQQHPGRRMVIFAGSGHVAGGRGIPNRLQRRSGASVATVLTDAGPLPSPDLADYLLFSRPRDLPKPGRLGLLLDDAGGGVRVKGFANTSGAREAGVEEGDLLVSLDGHPVHRYADVRLDLLDRRPGDQVAMVVRRAGLLGHESAYHFQVRLR